jgi:hypothetical protein
LRITNNDPRLFNSSSLEVPSLQYFILTVLPPVKEYDGLTDFTINIHLQNERKCNGTEYYIPIKYKLLPRFNKSQDEITEIHIGQSKTIKLRPYDKNNPVSKIITSFGDFL